MSLPENPFESGARKVIPAVLVYVRRGDQVLMIHRNSKVPGRLDYHEGRWNGLGGKCEVDESPQEAARREVHEESGLDLLQERFIPLGVIQFPNFKRDKKEDWLVFVFSIQLAADDFQDPRKVSEEGDLHWIPAKDLLSLNLWPGDRHFIPYVMESKSFMGTIWYQGQEVVRHWITQLAS